MKNPVLSAHFESRTPSSVRLAQIKYEARKIKPEAVINVGIGNVSLPANPSMMKRMFNLDAPDSPFKDGIVQYSSTVGYKETQDAFKNILAAEGFDTSNLHVQVTNGGSDSMELLLIGACGPAGSDESPLLMIDPAYTNYISFAKRVGRETVTIKRHLDENGTFSLPKMSHIEEEIKRYNPGALLVIPYDNPTGQLYDSEMMNKLAHLCVKYNMWMVSDEAYRELYYDDKKPLVSIWGITDQEVPGIEGRRISIETASKVWNACGLRIGALITDNAEFHTKSVAEYTANLCANVIGQYIFGALAHETKEDLIAWVSGLRNYYKKQIVSVYNGLKEIEPGLIISSPEASIYSVIDVRNVVQPGFDATEFVLYCASEGAIDIDGVETTLLVAPMNGFYDIKGNDKNPGSTQFRISFVESPENMSKIPELFVKLLQSYEAQR